VIEPDEIEQIRERLGEKKKSAEARAAALAQFVREKNGEAQRWKIELLQGVVRQIVVANDGHEATVEVEGRRIPLNISYGFIQISPGDEVLLVGQKREPFRAVAYYNATTEGSSLNAVKKTSRITWITVWAGSGIAAAILTTVVLAAVREPKFLSGIGLLHVVIYVTSILASGALLLIALLFLSFGASTRIIRRIIQEAEAMRRLSQDEMGVEN
jgi:hypothetical protein